MWGLRVTGGQVADGLPALYRFIGRSPLGSMGGARSALSA